MVRRVVIHAGFHKTGTTTVQKTLRANRKLLAPSIRIFLRAGMVPLCEAARAYSVTKGAWDLGLVASETAAIIGSVGPQVETVLIASEDIAGHMPGRRGLVSYAATPKICAAMEMALAKAAPRAEVTFHFTTRSAGPWLKSCHTQHLRATRITEDAAAYAKARAGSARLDDIVDKVAGRLENARVTRAALEDCDCLHGPLGPLLDLLGIPGNLRARIEMEPPSNTAPPQPMLDEMLRINRSDLSDEDAKAAKKALRREAF